MSPDNTKPSPAPSYEDCYSCRGFGHFSRRTGKPTSDRSERRCLDCSGDGKRLVDAPAPTAGVSAEERRTWETESALVADCRNTIAVGYRMVNTDPVFVLRLVEERDAASASLARAEERAKKLRNAYEDRERTSVLLFGDTGREITTAVQKCLKDLYETRERANAAEARLSAIVAALPPAEEVEELARSYHRHHVVCRRVMPWLLKVIDAVRGGKDGGKP